jgi:hypothetical protein
MTQCFFVLVLFIVAVAPFASAQTNVLAVVSDGDAAVVVYEDGVLYWASGTGRSLAVTPTVTWELIGQLPGGTIDEVSTLPDRSGFLVRRGTSVSWVRPGVSPLVYWTGAIKTFGSPVRRFSGLATSNVTTGAFVLVEYEDSTFGVGATDQAIENWSHINGPVLIVGSEPTTWGQLRTKFTDN